MQTTTHSSIQVMREAHAPQQFNAPFPPLALVNKPNLTTAETAYSLNRRPQTLRGWHCAGTYPDGLRPVRINGRLGWPVAGIRAALGVAA